MVPTFNMLIGLPGSGKSTYAKEKLKYRSHYEWVSSDAIRRELYGDESIQGDPSEVFTLMHDRVLEWLDYGISVIYDATNITRKDRACILKKLPDYVRKECTIIWEPIDVCIMRDFNRDRTVGKAIIDRMVRRFQVPFYDEGFDNIKVICDEQYSFEYTRNNYLEKKLGENDILHDNPNHTLKVKDHMMKAAEIIDAETPNPVLYHAALYHDIGKWYCKTYINTKGEQTDIAHYYDHQNVGGYMALPYSSSDTYLAWLINNHMEPFFNSKYYKNLPMWMKNDIDTLHKADREAH